MGVWASSDSSPAPRSRTETHIHAVSGRRPGPPQEHRLAPGCEGPPGGAGPTLTPRYCTGLSWYLGSQDRGRTHQTGPETRVPSSSYLGAPLPLENLVDQERREGPPRKIGRERGCKQARADRQTEQPRGCGQGVWSAAPSCPGVTAVSL